MMTRARSPWFPLLVAIISAGLALFLKTEAEWPYVFAGVSAFWGGIEVWDSWFGSEAEAGEARFPRKMSNESMSAFRLKRTLRSVGVWADEDILINVSVVALSDTASFHCDEVLVRTRSISARISAD